MAFCTCKQSSLTIRVPTILYLQGLLSISSYVHVRTSVLTPACSFILSLYMQFAIHVKIANTCTCEYTCRW